MRRVASTWTLLTFKLGVDYTSYNRNRSFEDSACVKNREQRKVSLEPDILNFDKCQDPQSI